MRITLQHLEQQSLAAEFEAPADPDPGECEAFALRKHPTSSAIALSPLLRRNCPQSAVWDSETGKLLWVPNKATDIGWSPDGRSVYLLWSQYIPTPDRLAGHWLQRYTWPGCDLEEELRFVVPSGSPHFLVVSPTGGLAAVVAHMGPDWTYVVLGLQSSLHELGVGYRIDEALVDGPVFSPDQRYIVSIGSANYVWWACPDEEQEEDVDGWQIPCEGGCHEFGWVYVHDLEELRVTRHTLVADLSPGWQPQPRNDDPSGKLWMLVWGPQFTSDRAFRISLPGGSLLELRLPLPESIHIESLPQTWQG